jgi:hypothetical protein
MYVRSTKSMDTIHMSYYKEQIQNGGAFSKWPTNIRYIRYIFLTIEQKSDRDSIVVSIPIYLRYIKSIDTIK